MPVRAISLAALLVAVRAEAGWDYAEAPGSVRDPDVAERAARAYVAAHADRFGKPELVVVANQLDGDVRSVGFRQTWHGMPVIGGQLGVMFSHDHLFAVIDHTYRGITASGRGTAILPVGKTFHVVDVRDTRDAVIYEEAGRELARESKIIHATSTLEYDVGTRYATGARAPAPAPATWLTVNAAAATTAADGTFTWTGTSPATVVPQLVGTFVQIVNQAGALATASLTAQSGQPTIWSLATDEQGDAELSAYIYAGLAKQHARIVNPAVATWLDTTLSVYVNESGACNAYATNDDIHFALANSTCQNTARVADVVFHEFGHVLHHHSVITGVGMFEVQLSEGLADFFAADLNEDSGVGRGLYFNDEPARDIDPYGLERVWPVDIDFDTHVTGEIVSGALWDVRRALIRKLGHTIGAGEAQRIFTGIMQRAVDIPSSYIAALVADDNNGDLSDGTPNKCEIDRAFGVHGIGPAGFTTTTVAPPTVGGLAISTTVSTPVDVTCPPPQVTAISISWRAGDGVPSTFALTQVGTQWLGEFPEQHEGTIISYLLDASLDDGSHIVLPNNPADPLYQVFVGTPIPIQCWNMDTDPMWTQTGNLGDEWQWAVPDLVNQTRDPIAAHTGSEVLGTDITHDGLYKPNELTSIATPVVDVSSYQIVHLQYWRWLTVEDATYDRATITVNGTQVWQNVAAPSGTLDHVDREWRFQDFDLTQLTGGTVQAQWSLQSDATNQLGGWTLDDVCIVGMTKLPHCGDGILDPGEVCDDGNNANDDGCSSTCQAEITAGGGGCNAGGGGSAWLSVAVALRALCRRDRSRRSCRNRCAGRADRRRS